VHQIYGTLLNQSHKSCLRHQPATQAQRFAIGPANAQLLFLDEDTLVYGYGALNFARVAWQGQTLGQPYR